MIQAYPTHHLCAISSRTWRKRFPIRRACSSFATGGDEIHTDRTTRSMRWFSPAHPWTQDYLWSTPRFSFAPAEKMSDCQSVPKAR